MSVQLAGLSFHHSGSGDSTLLLRRNASKQLAVPEWQPAMGSSPEFSIAAYVLDRIAGRPLTILAQFAIDNPRRPSVFIRAIEPPIPAIGREQHRRLQPAIGEAELLNTTVGVLGEVAETRIPATPGLTNWQSLMLPRARLGSSGVGDFVIEWRWQYRWEQGEPWTDFALTRHRILAVLHAPTAPWTQAADPVHLPWTDVLVHACQWAAGARNRREAASLITRRVYSLGATLLTYGCPIDALTAYAFPYFDCTAFLQRLAGGLGNGGLINCSDCAAIVSTFANILGCDLWQSRMRPPDPRTAFFPVNPILAIGSHVWDQPCGSWPGFAYHEVAWTGNLGANDTVFDACLAVDSDINPARAPHSFHLPTDLRFGRPNEGVYLDMLVPPAGRAICVPDPLTRMRRPVVPGRGLPFLAASEKQQVAERFHLRDAPAKAAGNLLVMGFVPTASELNDWVPLEARRLKTSQLVDGQRTMWRLAAAGGEALLRIEIFDCANAKMALGFLRRLLASVHLPGFYRLADGTIGDVAFASSKGTAILFASANLVVSMANAGKVPVELAAYAQMLDRSIRDMEGAVPVGAQPALPPLVGKRTIKFAARPEPEEVVSEFAARPEEVVSDVLPTRRIKVSSPSAELSRTADGSVRIRGDQAGEVTVFVSEQTHGNPGTQRRYQLNL